MPQAQTPPTTLQASVSKTATFDGAGVAISSLKSNSVVRLKIKSLTAGKTVTYALQDSADDFSSDIVTLATFRLKGEIQTIAPREEVFQYYQLVGNRFGVTSAKLRLSIINIDSATTVVYEAFIHP